MNLHHAPLTWKLSPNMPYMLLQCLQANPEIIILPQNLAELVQLKPSLLIYPYGPLTLHTLQDFIQSTDNIFVT